MKIIEPKVELWRQEDAKAHVARCARVCYGKETGNDEATIKRLINSKHWSMFRHETVYAMIPIELWYGNFGEILKDYKASPYISWVTVRDYIYVSTNGNFMLDIEKYEPVLYNEINNYRVSEEEFNSCEIAYNLFARWTFCVDTQISTSRELNRVSPNNIAEMSTRYVYEDGSICRPHWISKKEAELFNNDNNADLDEAMNVYLNGCKRDFEEYKVLVDKYKIHRQDARGKLPLDTATRCIYTYSIDEYRHILDLRYYGTTGTPHPNAKIIAGMIRNNLMELGYDFRD
ncbi:MAG: Thymidylate synthase complementing protein [Bacteriophage sp.]|nr:MAG: Thymidylate synthase complementing protein [Bacteriophage sp.]